MIELVTIKRYLYRHDAEMAKGLLSDKGIDAMIITDDCGGFRPYMAFGSAIRLLVRKEDVTKAMDILLVLEEDIEE